MRRLSLTWRLVLLFMLACSLVLLVATASLQHVSQVHLEELDRHALDEEIATVSELVAGAATEDEIANWSPVFIRLFQTHRQLHLRLLGGDGQLLFSSPVAGNAIPPHMNMATPDAVWEWSLGSVHLRGMTTSLPTTDPQRPLTLMVAMDISQHVEFFRHVQYWVYGGLVLFSLLGGLLGWVVVCTGLIPLRTLTARATGISVHSLQQQIRQDDLPPELVPLAGELNAMLIRLSDAFGRLNNFSADIAHELRTPLARVITRIEVVLGRTRSLEDYRDALHDSLETLQGLNRMVDDMLFLARADNGQMVPLRRRIWLASLLDGLLDYYRLLADEMGIRIECHGNGRLDGDPAMLRRALSNLLSNALRHTPQHGWIRVTIQQDSQGVRLEVANSGVSIPAADLPRLFDRFYRADPARSRGHGNVGLGLPITRSIIEAHGGSITCTSRDGVTCFVLQFDAAPAELPMDE